jgi:hypothetical protein
MRRTITLMNASTSTNLKFTRADWFKLFMVCAFPLHLWTILMVFRDVNWVAERTTFWDAIGFTGYALFYTLVESILLFGFISLLGLLVPRNWSKSMRFVSLSLVGFALAGWSIIEQLILIIFFGRLRKLGIANPWLVSASPLITAGLIAISVAAPLLILRKSSKLQKAGADILERLTMLSGLYLFLDFVGIVVILIRNLGGLS